MDRDSLELFLSNGLSLEEIGKRLGRHPSTVGYWVKKYGLEAPNRERHLPRGALAAADLSVLAEEGMTLREIAAATGRSVATVRHWMRRYGIKTRNRRGPRRGQAAVAARREGKAVIRQECSRHGLTEFYLEGRGYYRCRRCRAEAVVRRRRKVKAILVAEAGGCCVLCGYDESPRVLEFHHLDPAQKSFGLAAGGPTLSLERMRAEARKCVLLCSNCHAAVELGLKELPALAA